jgi:gamma-glutamyltranspeptidase/glutathione hydrolase
MSFGVMGGHMQAQGHVQMMIRVLGHGQNPQAASDAPRWHLTEQGDLALESGVSKKTQEALIARGHRLLLNQPEHLFGGAQLIARLPGGGYCAGSDHRKEGLAAGF